MHFNVYNEILKNLPKMNKALDEYINWVEEISKVKIFIFRDDIFWGTSNKISEELNQIVQKAEENKHNLEYVIWVDENMEELKKTANYTAEYAKKVCEEAHLAADRVEEAKKQVKTGAVNKLARLIARNN